MPFCPIFPRLLSIFPHCFPLKLQDRLKQMNNELSIAHCRKILGDAGRKLTDQEIEKLRDTFIALSDFVIDGEIEKLRLRKNENSYERPTSK